VGSLSRNVAGEVTGYLKGVAQARHWPASACWKCRRRRPGPHRCPARSRVRYALVALVWAVAAGLCVLPGLWPPYARFLAAEQYPLGVTTGLLAGWWLWGRKRRA
jgi:hypothetical protein